MTLPPFGSQWSLRRHLILWNIAALAILFAIMGVTARFTITNLLMDSVKRNLQAEVASAAPPPIGMRDSANRPFEEHDSEGPGPPPDAGEGPGSPPSRERDNLYAVRHFDLQGRPIGVRPLLDSHAFARAKQGEHVFSRLLIDGAPLEILTVPYRTNGTITAVIQAAYPLTEIERAFAGLDRALLLLIPVGLLGAGGGGAYLTHRVLNRVRRTAQTAEQIRVSADGEVSARLAVVGKDEFAELATAFNGLLGRLEVALKQQVRLLEQQRRFVADASHELKTPLTVIRGTASMTYGEESTEADFRRSLQKIDRASEGMSHLVGDLLLLARSDSGQLGKNRIEILVREILAQAVSLVAHRGVPIQLNVTVPDLTIFGRETELVRVFTNLLENAARHTPPSGLIRVTAEMVHGGVEICVADTGSGIAPEHLPHLGERFYRVDSARARAHGGTGLGLSISRSIVEAHGGTLALDSILGQGTCVYVRLPSQPGEAV